jgi:hypothetical protein
MSSLSSRERLPIDSSGSDSPVRIAVEHHPGHTDGDKKAVEHASNRNLSNEPALRLFLGEKRDRLLVFFRSIRYVTAAQAAIDTETLLPVSLPVDDEVALSILNRAMAGIAFYFSYSNATAAHLSSFLEISTKLESCPQSRG